MSRPKTVDASTFRVTDADAAQNTFRNALRAVVNADPKQVDEAMQREQAEREAKRQKGEK